MIWYCTYIIVAINVIAIAIASSKFLIECENWYMWRQPYQKICMITFTCLRTTKNTLCTCITGILYIWIYFINYFLLNISIFHCLSYSFSWFFRTHKGSRRVDWIRWDIIIAVYASVFIYVFLLPSIENNHTIIHSYFLPYHITSHHITSHHITLSLCSGAHVNHVESEGWNALHFAAHNGHKETCDFLIKNKCSLGEENDEGL